MPSSASTPTSTSTSATPTAPGNEAPTRTPTDCSASTSPRAPTSPSTAKTTSTPRPTRSTTDPVRPWTGSNHPRSSPSSSLRTPAEPARRRARHVALRTQGRTAGPSGAAGPSWGRPSRAAVDDAAFDDGEEDLAGAVVAEEDEIGVGAGGEAALGREAQGVGGVPGRRPPEVGPSPAGGGGEAPDGDVEGEDAAGQPAVGQPDPPPA